MISNEKLIEYLSHPDDKQHYDRATSAFESKYRSMFQKYVGIKYSDKKYFQYKDEIYGIFISCFFEYISRDNARKLRNIEDPEKLDVWMDITTRRYAEAIRKKVDDELGIRKENISFDLVYGADKDIDGDFYLEDDFKNAQNNQSTSEIEDEATHKVDVITEISDILDGGDDPEWAYKLLEQLLDNMTSDRYAEIIRKIKLEGMPIEEATIYFGFNSEATMYAFINKAMTQLFKTALPLIQKNSRYMFRTCGDLMKKDDEELLYKFFIEKKSVKMLIKEYKMLETKMTDALIKAYKRLMKIYIEHNKEISYEHE